jgi:restriction system protein
MIPYNLLLLLHDDEPVKHAPVRSQLSAEKLPSVALQAIIIPGEKTTEGQIIEAVAIPWFEIIETILKDPENAHQIDWRKWEEIIAGAYKQRGCGVVLTPRSGDKGRDIIATVSGLQIRIFDQVKAYKPGHVVTLQEVHSMLGVLSAAPNVSKGVITTTSSFAPGVLTDPEVQKFAPYRLELKAREQLLQELRDLATR